jgi:hypothetical protein
MIGLRREKSLFSAFHSHNLNESLSVTTRTVLYWYRSLTSPAMTKTESQKILQSMSPAKKLRAAERLYHSARQLKAAALRVRHPDWTEEAILQAVRQIFLYARS